MVKDIQKWEYVTGEQFNLLDHSNRLTTLPSVYNVVAMNARPLNVNEWNTRKFINMLLKEQK
ncbi:MAG: hypothetical protein U9R53_11090 [Chloroflexota bacterium]|nr:hypothetical protein [Chloroflexota bacterium]